MPETLKPMDSHIVVLKDPEVQFTEGGLEIPEFSRDVPRTARVMAVGPGYYNSYGTWINTELHPGQRVLIHPFCGYTINLDGTDYQIIQEADVHGVIGEDVVATKVAKTSLLPKGCQILDGSNLARMGDASFQ